MMRTVPVSDSGHPQIKDPGVSTRAQVLAYRRAKNSSSPRSSILRRMRVAGAIYISPDASMISRAKYLSQRNRYISSTIDRIGKGTRHTDRRARAAMTTVAESEPVWTEELGRCVKLGADTEINAGACSTVPADRSTEQVNKKPDESRFATVGRTSARVHLSLIRSMLLSGYGAELRSVATREWGPSWSDGGFCQWSDGMRRDEMHEDASKRRLTTPAENGMKQGSRARTNGSSCVGTSCRSLRRNDGKRPISEVGTGNVW